MEKIKKMFKGIYGWTVKDDEIIAPKVMEGVE